MTGLPRLPEPPFRRAVPTTPADRAGARVDCFSTHAAFPKWPEGRHPHCHFRGLLRLHLRYGPSDRSAAKATFVTRLQPSQLPGQAARQLPDQSTTLWVESSSTDDSRLRGARPYPDLRTAAKHRLRNEYQLRSGCSAFGRRRAFRASAELWRGTTLRLSICETADRFRGLARLAYMPRSRRFNVLTSPAVMLVTAVRTSSSATGNDSALAVAPSASIEL